MIFANNKLLFSIVTELSVGKISKLDIQTPYSWNTEPSRLKGVGVLQFLHNNVKRFADHN